MSPSALLLLLCCCILLLFGDRGAVSANSVSGDASQGIRYDFGLSVAKSGWVYAAIMVSNLTIELPRNFQSSVPCNVFYSPKMGSSAHYPSNRFYSDLARTHSIPSLNYILDWTCHVGTLRSPP